MAETLNRFFNQDENIGVLSVTTGQLNVARIPVNDAPDWILPESLILTIEPYQERIWTYLWKGQDVPVYHLLPKTMTPTHLVVVESVTDVHRIALQIHGDVSFQSVRIADLKDAEEANYRDFLQQHYPAFLANLEQVQQPYTDSRVNNKYQALDNSYIFQLVVLHDEICIVPDLDKLSHFLVDLDS